MMEDPLILEPYPPAFVWKQNHARPHSDRSADMMQLLTNPSSLKIYMGEEQPPPEERLEQVKIFLADEDFYRNLNFRDKLNDIEGYVEFLDLNHYKADGDTENRLLTRVKEMIHVHKARIRKATEVPSMTFSTGRFTHQNRLMHMIKNWQNLTKILNKKGPEVPRELAWSSAPALHKCIDENDRLPSPDPFRYTKQVAEVRTRQETLQGSFPAMNFQGPYFPLPGGRAKGDQARTRQQDSATRDFAVASIIDIAQPLNPDAELTEIHAAHLLQKQILAEHNHNWGHRTPNYATLWGFADEDQKSNTFFSLDRWPLELQSPEQRDKIRESGPKPYALSKTSSQPRAGLKKKKRVVFDPNERYVPGETLFPFGETQIQAVRQSQMIDSMLANAPEFAHLYATKEQGKEIWMSQAAPVDLLVLPELPERQQDSAQAHKKTLREGEGSAIQTRRALIAKIRRLLQVGTPRQSVERSSEPGSSRRLGNLAREMEYYGQIQYIEL